MKEGFLILLFTLFSIVLTPFLIFISNQIGFYDIPNERKLHKKNIPFTGGVIIITSIFLGLFFVEIEPVVIIISLFSFFVFLLGIIDDKLNLPAIIKLIFQIIIVVFFLLNKKIQPLWIHISNIFLIDFLINIFWMIIIINAINLIDGIDGLALLIATITFTCFIIFASGKTIGGYYLLFVILGSLLGLLKYNLPPAKIFLGDNGALLLGFLIASYSMSIASKMFVTYSIFVPLTLILIPVFDVFVVSAKRFKLKKSIFKADKNHIHHDLLELGFTEREVLMILGFLTSIFAVITVLKYSIDVFVIYVLIILIFDLILIYLRFGNGKNLKEKIKIKNKNLREKFRKIVLGDKDNIQIKKIDFFIMLFVFTILTFSYLKISWSYTFYLQFLLFVFILILNNYFHFGDDTTRIFSNFTIFWLYLFLCYKIFQFNYLILQIIGFLALILNVIKLIQKRKFDLFIYNPMEIILVHILLIFLLRHTISFNLIIPAILIYNLTKDFFMKDTIEYKLFYPPLILISFFIPLIKILR